MNLLLPNVNSGATGDEGSGDRSGVLARADWPAEKGVFRREGDYWAIGYAGNVFRLKHSKGLSYIAYLLRHPATEFHVLDLEEGIEERGPRRHEETPSVGSLARNPEELKASGIHVGGLGDAGEMLDEQAKASYKARLIELREELEDARQLGNVERAAQAEEEIDALTKELSRAVGLGGRNRRAASAAERARQRAKKAIKTAIERIAENDPNVGGMFSRCIRTGIYCSYAPEPDFEVEWQSGSTGGAFARPQARWGRSIPTSIPESTEDTSTSATAELLSPLFVSPNPTSFTGREAEIGHLRTVVQRALDGEGSIVPLSGEPGVGKTRLALEAANYASRCGFGFLIGRCYEREGPRPYLPFEEIIETAAREAASTEAFRSAVGDNASELAQIAPRLRRLFPDIPPPPELPPQETRRYLFQGVSETFVRIARRAPLFLVLDDLQWADESSLALLTHLGRRVARFPMVIVGTYRDSDLELNSALARTLEELHRAGISPIRLLGLAEGEVAMMLRGLSRRDPPAQLVKLVFDETQGNPFFVEELYKHLVEERKIFDASGQFRSDVKLNEIDVPDSVRLVVGRRLERLGQSGKHVLTAAAVIGRTFSFRLLEMALSHFEVDDLLTAIEQAQRMGLIIPSSEGPEAPFRFAHEIVRQTLLADSSLPRRQRLHLRVADAIEKVDAKAQSERAAEIALHLVQAGSASDKQTAGHFLTLAGNAALEAAAYEAALSHFESALSRVDENDSRRKAELFCHIAIAKRGLGRWDEAHLNSDKALNIYNVLGDREAIGRVSFGIAQTFVWAGRYREAWDVADRSLAQLKGAISADRARLLAILGLSKAVEGDYLAAQHAFENGLALAEHLSDSSLRGLILAFRLQFNFFFLRLREALEDSRESAELMPAESSPWPCTGGSPWPHTQRLCWTQCALQLLGRPQEATKVREELEPLAARIGNVAALSYCLRGRAWTEFGARSDLTQLRNKLQKDLDANRAAGLDVFVAISHAQLGVAEFFSGNWEKGLEHAQEACRPQAPHVLSALSMGTLFRQKAYTGDRDSALAFLRQHSEKLPSPHETSNLGSWAMLLLVVEGLFVLGEREQAAALYPLVRELIATGTVWIAFISRFSQTVAGIAAAAARQWEAAEEHFQIASRQAQDFPHVLELAEVCRFHGAMLLARGASNDLKKARLLLAQARDSYAQIGMPRHGAIVEALLNRLDEPQGASAFRE